jgi:general secretion pathway protein G
MNSYISPTVLDILTAQPERHRRNRGARAFTLIELMLVLVILAVLAAVVVPKLAGKGQQARITAATTDISNLDTVLDNFEVDTGRYPTSQEGLNALIGAPSGLQGWKGPYLKKAVPNDPWGNPYVYRNPGQHNTEGYDLYSFGPNGQEGDTDDVTNWTK